MVRFERREVVPMAAPEGRVFLEEAFLDVEAEVLCFVVLVARLDLRRRESVDASVLEQDVEERLSLELRVLREDLGRPDLVWS
jgi:hypothetical protein